MPEFAVNLDKISKEDAISIATSLLYSLKGSPQHSTTSELAYILDYSNFNKLIKYYGGMTIRIPTLDEVNELLSILLLYQYYVVEERPWHEALSKSGVKSEDSVSAKFKLTSLKKLLSNQEIGGRHYE